MVGNSGRLKGSGHGLQIDAHDWVLRWVTQRGLVPPCPSLSPWAPGMPQPPVKSANTSPAMAGGGEGGEGGTAAGSGPWSHPTWGTHWPCVAHIPSLLLARVTWCPCLVGQAAWDWHNVHLNFGTCLPTVPQDEQSEDHWL